MKRILAMPAFAMKSMVCSRRTGNPLVAVVTIASERHEHLHFPLSLVTSLSGLLRLTFTDLFDPEEPNTFTEEQARTLVSFVDLRKEVPFWFVNCAAGVSRSGAVALWLCRYLGHDEEQFWKDNPNVLPNRLVLSTLERVAPYRVAP